MTTSSRANDQPGRDRLSGIIALVIGTAVLIALTALLAPGSAIAAGTAPAKPENPDAQYYRSTVTAIEPAVPGLEVTTHGGGESITLTNRTGKQVLVLGYSGEPYLRFTPDGVQVNGTSPTAALNADGSRSVPPAPAGRPKPAQWRPVGDGNSFTWQDFRPQWSAEQRPPIVTADPQGRHQVFAWAVQLTVDAKAVLVRGDVTWIGEPQPRSVPLIITAGGGGLLAVALIGLVVALVLRRNRIRRRDSHAIRPARSGERTAQSTGAR
jgi:hypothetical protein